MKITFLGTGNAFTKTKGHSSAFLDLEGDCPNILIDAGFGVEHELDKHIKITDTELRILLTHEHPDHIGGLGNLIFWLYYVKNLSSVSILCVDINQYAGVQTLLSGQHIMKSDMPADFVKVNYLPSLSGYSLINSNSKSDPDTALVQQFVYPIRVPHIPNVPCYGFAFIEVRKTVAGVVSKDVIIYSGDTNEFVLDSLDSYNGDISKNMLENTYRLSILHEASLYDTSPEKVRMHIHITELLQRANHILRDSTIPEVELHLYHLPDDIVHKEQLRKYGDVDSLVVLIPEKGETL